MMLLPDDHIRIEMRIAEQALITQCRRVLSEREADLETAVRQAVQSFDFVGHVQAEIHKILPKVVSNIVSNLFYTQTSALEGSVATMIVKSLLPPAEEVPA